MPEAHAGMMVTPSVRLVRPLGEGGMGSVWVAEQLALHTNVVVKFIASGLQNSKEAIERFSREAAAAAQVKSPHVVQTFDHGVTEDGVPYIVMELLEGRDLGVLLDQQGSLEPPLALAIVAQLSRALGRAHERGIVHRDIKPGNIFLCDAGGGEVFVKLLDFGIAKGVEMPTLDSATKTGSMIGSPFYMSPEQILGSKLIDHRSDLWSVGIVAFEMLTGQKPFDAETMGGLAIKIHSGPMPFPSEANPRLSPSVDAWFHRACARKVDERFSSAKEMAEAFAAALGGEVPRSIDMPRTSTGSTDPGSHAPTLAAGATTEAGIVTSMRPGKTRKRLITLAVTIPACVLLGIVGVRAIVGGGHEDAHRGLVAADPPPASATTSGASVMSTLPSPPPSPGAANGVGDVIPPPPTGVVPPGPSGPSVTPASLASSNLGSRPHGRPHAPTTRPSASPAVSSLPPSPTPPATAKPAPTGNDIF